MRQPNPGRDMQEAQLRPKMSAETISMSAASNIGAGGRAIGAAISDVGNAFAQIAGRAQETSDKQNDARFSLAWNKAQAEAWNQTSQSAGEDGSGWDTFAPSLQERYAALDKEYPVSGSDRRLSREIGVGNDVLRQGQRAAQAKLQAAHKYYTGIEQKEISGALQQLESDPSQENYDRIKGLTASLIDGGKGNYYTQADVDRRKREVSGLLAASRVSMLIKRDPVAAGKLLEQMQAANREPPKTPGQQTPPGNWKIYDSKVPSAAERRQIFQSGGVVVNLDTNWSKGGSQTSPMVVIPDGATPQQRQAAEAYASQVAELYKKQFGQSLAPRVVTRSENGRGRDATIHTEPFAVTDERAAKFFKSAEGLSAHADILRGTLGKIPGVQFSIPHDPSRSDRGAAGKHGNEVEFAQSLIGQLRGGGTQTAVAGAVQSDGVSQIVQAEGRRDGQGRLQVYKLPSNDGGGTYEVAGINDRYHPKAAEKLAGLIQSGKHDEAETYATDYIREYTNKSAGLVSDPAAQYLVRDVAFNRGAGGANAVLRIAIGGQPGSKTAAHRALTEAEKKQVAELAPQDLIERMTQARAQYEKQFVGTRSNLQAGLESRWKSARENALGMLGGNQQAQPEQRAGLTGDEVEGGINTTVLAQRVFGDDAERLIGIAEDNPDMKLTDVAGIDDGEMSQIAERLGIDPTAVTVGQALKAAQELAGGPREAQPPRADIADVPLSRLEEGQTFEVESRQFGQVKFSAQDINAIDSKVLQQFGRMAKERVRTYARQQQAIAEDLMQRQVATISETGRSAADFDPEVIRQAYGDNPKKIAAFNRKMELAKRLHTVTGDMDDQDEETLRERLSDLEDDIVGRSGADPEARTAFDRASRLVEKHMQLRERDPARAVAKSEEVKAALARMPRGAPTNAKESFALVDARMKAQVRLGITPTPITKGEANKILSDMARAEPRDRRVVAERTLQLLQKTYGGHASKVMETALRLSSLDDEDDRGLFAMTERRMDRERPKATGRPGDPVDEDVIEQAITPMPGRGDRLPIKPQGQSENPFLR